MPPRQKDGLRLSEAKQRTFIVGPGVLVRPRHEFLIYPTEQTNRGVGEPVPERLWSS